MRPHSQDQPLEPTHDSGSGADTTQLDSHRLADYPHGFEEDDQLRSSFIRHLTLQQLRADRAAEPRDEGPPRESIPRVLARFWHDSNDVPPDVQACLESWNPLRSQGIAFRMFCDASAASFIATRFGPREVAAFARCRHPAMRSDYLRMCFLFAEGGLYVDADDVLIGDGWRNVFRSDSLKVQPLCYDVRAGSMVPSADLSRTDLPTSGRIFYVNNNPIAAPAGHQVLRRALARSTSALLGDDPAPEIQSTTGPGNLTAALAAYARSAHINHTQVAIELLLDWEQTAETRWDLEYRNDARNWRNMDRNKSLGS